MRTEKLGALQARIVGGTDGQGGGNGPVVVLMHGFGAPGTDLVPLARALRAPEGTRFVFPEAPLDLSQYGGMGARAWWMIDMVALDRAMRDGAFRDLAEDVPSGLVEARGMVSELLSEVEARLAPPPGQIVLGGFSQGAMLTMDVALHDARALAGLILFSGTLISRTAWVSRLASRSGLRVMQSHGSFDPILPFAAAESLRDLLVGGGLDVDFVPFRGGHEIPPGALMRASALLTNVLRPAEG